MVGVQIGPQGRLLSLDVFRGATIAGMILVNNPGSWEYVYPQLRHAAWHGWTMTDTIFPFFLWIVGVAMTFSFAKRMEHGEDKNRLLLHSVRRAAIIFALGLLIFGLPGLLFDPAFSFGALRIPGVLQRIAICYLVVSVIYLNAGIRAQVVWMISPPRGLLAPDEADPGARLRGRGDGSGGKPLLVYRFLSAGGAYLGLRTRKRIRPPRGF